MTWRADIDAEEPDAQEVVQLIQQAGRKAVALPGDIRDEAHCKAIVERAVSDLGGLDILVNNAATNPYMGPTIDIDPSRWDKILQVNLTAPLFWTQKAWNAAMSEHGGVVINISSWLGKFITPLAGPSYAASKFGAAALTETINAEDGLNGVRACVICPAEVATPILKKRPIVPPQEEQDRMLQEDDLGRTIAFVAAMPSRACINEIIISPTYNRFYFGGREIDQVKK